MKGERPILSHDWISFICKSNVDPHLIKGDCRDMDNSSNKMLNAILYKKNKYAISGVFAF